MQSGIWCFQPPVVLIGMQSRAPVFTPGESSWYKVRYYSKSVKQEKSMYSKRNSGLPHLQHRVSYWSYCLKVMARARKPKPMGNSTEANPESCQIEGRIVLHRRGMGPQSSPTLAGGDAG